MTGPPVNTKAASTVHVAGCIAAVICGLVLVRSAMFHLGNPFGFLATVYSYELLPAAAGVAVAAVLPPTQLVLGLLIILFPQHRKPCLSVSGLLFLSLALVQLLTLYRGLNISCGCFGPAVDENPIGVSSIGLAVGCSALAFAGSWMVPHAAQQLTPEPENGLHAH